MKCLYLLPEKELSLVRWNDPLPSCLLEEGHKGEHLIRTSYGGYATWAHFTEACGADCACLHDTNYIGFECFYFGEVTHEEAQRLIAESKQKPPD